MKILYVLDYYLPSVGGVEKVFSTLINFFSKNNEIIVLTSRFDSSLPFMEENKNIKIFRIGKSRLSFTIFGFILNFFLLLFFKPDLVHTSTYNAAYVSFVAKFFKIPVLLTSHEIVGGLRIKFKGIKGFFYYFFEKFIYKLGYFYVFVSYHVRNVALSFSKIKKFSVVYNGVDIKEVSGIDRKILGFSDKDFIGVFAGRPGWLKGLDFLLKNFEELKKISPNFKLLLLLLEKYNHKKHDFVKKYQEKFKDDIKIMYEIPFDKVYSYVKVADFGIVCSRSEGFGFTCYEFSKLLEKNLFSFTGAIPEISFGKIVFFKVDSDKSFVSGFKKLHKDKIDYYLFDKNLSEQKMVNSYKKIYQDLVNN